MSIESDPLVTRSLPGALWEKVPKYVSENDENLRAWFASHLDGSQSPWKEIRWLTENDWGVSLLSAIFILVYLYLARKHTKNIQRFPEFLKHQLMRVVVFLLLLGFSNVLSVALKRLIGRLKPHVNWWDKAAPIPALSCPSSHAFNTAFFITLLFLILSKNDFSIWKKYLWTLLACVSLVGVSRVVFTQHYPLDVLLGWILGAGFAFFMRPFLYKLLRMKRS
jgi:membrane-associated phospholipid phosphatase